jgi:hypothetical protein
VPRTLDSNRAGLSGRGPVRDVPPDAGATVSGCDGASLLQYVSAAYLLTMILAVGAQGISVPQSPGRLATTAAVGKRPSFAADSILGNAVVAHFLI